jgi:hypothetical protein
VYSNIPGRPLEYASTILACLAFLVTMPIYVFYVKGPSIREKSKFAQSLDTARQKKKGERTNSTAAAGVKTGADEEKNVDTARQRTGY